MTGKNKFAMAFHCYQPVFNLEEEFDKAYEKAYLPLLNVFEDTPEIKATFHFPGNMLEWFKSKHPDYLAKIKRLLSRGQIELIGGGCFEPIMTLIPEVDRRGQISMNNSIIEDLFGVKPKGSWLTERVWDPELVDTLISLEVKYTIIDDHHLFRAGIKAEDIFCPYRTKGAKGRLTLFPIFKQLRYAMPFNAPKEVIRHMKDRTDDKVGPKNFFFADDGEKFGRWPHTYKLVYTKGWLRKFFLLLKENSAWLETVTYSDLLDSAETKDVGEVPMSSYSEMMEWSGGNFRNFLKKYPEAERMHSRMIGVSETISNIFLEDLTDEKYREAETAKKELFKAQSGCAYWHGAFGGVYLPHLREGVYKHLIRSQGIIDTFEAGNGKSICIVEHDSDKNETETAIRNNFMDVYFESCGGGKIKELDHKVRGINLTNIISRSKEKYHKKLNRGYFKKIKKARCLAFKGETVDIHDILGVKDRGLKKILFYDKKERTSFNTHLFTDSFSLRDMYRGRTGNNAFLNGTYKSDIQVEGSVANAWFSKEDVIKKDRGKEFRVEVEKRVIVGTKPEIKFYHKTVSQIEIQCAIEYNFLIWDKWSGKIPRHVKTDKFLLRDQYSGLGLEFSFNKKLNVFTYPIFTINESEMGLKKTFQGICLFVSPIGRNKENSTDVMEINLKLG